MTANDNPLTKEYDDQLKKHEKANLLARLVKLLEYDEDDIESDGFRQNFLDMKKQYEKLKR